MRIRTLCTTTVALLLLLLLGVARCEDVLWEDKTSSSSRLDKTLSNPDAEVIALYAATSAGWADVAVTSDGTTVKGTGYVSAVAAAFIDTDGGAENVTLSVTSDTFAESCMSGATLHAVALSISSPNMIPGKDGFVYVTETTQESISLRWEAVASSMASYTVVWRRGGETEKDSLDFDLTQFALLTPDDDVRDFSSESVGSKTEHTIEGLNKQEVYYVSVIAYSDSGEAVPYAARAVYTHYSDSVAWPADIPIDGGAAKYAEITMLPIVYMCAAVFVAVTFMFCVFGLACIDSIEVCGSYLNSGEGLLVSSGCAFVCFIPAITLIAVGISTAAKAEKGDFLTAVCYKLDTFTYECGCYVDEYGNEQCDTCTETDMALLPDGARKPKEFEIDTSFPGDDCTLRPCRYPSDDLTRLKATWGLSPLLVMGLSVFFCMPAACVGSCVCNQVVVAKYCRCHRTSFSSNNNNNNNNNDNENPYARNTFVGPGFRVYEHALIRQDDGMPWHKPEGKTGTLFGSLDAASEKAFNRTTFRASKTPPDYIMDDPLSIISTCQDMGAVFGAPSKVVLFGPPCVGKGVILQLAKKCGYCVVDLDHVGTDYKSRLASARKNYFNLPWRNGVLICAADLRREDIPSSFTTVLLLPPLVMFTRRQAELPLPRPRRRGEETPVRLYKLMKMSAVRFHIVIRKGGTAQVVLNEIVKRVGGSPPTQVGEMSVDESYVSYMSYSESS